MSLASFFFFKAVLIILVFDISCYLELENWTHAWFWNSQQLEKYKSSFHSIQLWPMQISYISFLFLSPWTEILPHLPYKMKVGRVIKKKCVPPGGIPVLCAQYLHRNMFIYIDLYPYLSNRIIFPKNVWNFTQKYVRIWNKISAPCPKKN